MAVMATEVSFEQRQALRQRMHAMTERLVAEYSDIFPAGSIIRCVSRHWIQTRHAGGDGDVVAATEAAVRRRLAMVLPAHSLK